MKNEKYDKSEMLLNNPHFRSYKNLSSNEGYNEYDDVSDTQAEEDEENEDIENDDNLYENYNQLND
jgi:hypothetical protein